MNVSATSKVKATENREVENAIYFLDGGRKRGFETRLV